MHLQTNGPLRSVTVCAPAQVSGAQDGLEATATALVRLRLEVAAALEDQLGAAGGGQAGQRRQAMTVAVRLGRFSWALIGRDKAPFVQVRACA